MKQQATATLETCFVYSPYRNGARKDPASAPHEIPIICAIKRLFACACLIAMIAEMMTNMTMNTRMMTTFFLSSIGFFFSGPIKSSVIVDELVSTNDDSVDMDADKTSTMMIPIIIGETVESMLGMTASNPSASTSISYSLPKPPRK